MFKIPGLPSPQAHSHELADFIELECVKETSVSARQVLAALNRIADNDYTDGVDEEEDIDIGVEEAFSEIENRIRYTNNRYPFSLDSTGSILTIRNDDEKTYWLYVYLLLATRLNMQSARSFAEIDGTFLFEELSAEIAKNYLGERAESLIFGTSSGSSDFSDKIDELCGFLKEGCGFRSRTPNPTTAKDGKLDIVVLKHFYDERAGKLIGFGQCKTGTNWRDKLTQLHPQTFCSKWLQDMPAFFPIRLFFLCEALSNKYWYEDSSDSGILFDRCRCMDFSENISDELSTKIVQWTKAAIEHVIAM